MKPVANLKAAHWFGRQWPVNFWTSNLEAYADLDFQKIAGDGFNAVVLVVPWTGFVDHGAVKINPEMLARLESLIEQASCRGLRTVLRVGYPWNSAVGVQPALVLSLFTDNVVYWSWLLFMEEINRRFTANDNVALCFISWEDYWAVIQVGDDELARRRLFASQSGFQEFLKANMTLEEASNWYNTRFSEWSYVPFPERRHTSFFLFFEFFKHSFINRFYRPAAQRLPGLSAEVRVDLDAVFNGDVLHST